MPKFKIVWYVQEYDETPRDDPAAQVARLCIPPQQTIIEFSEDKLRQADEKDAEKIKELIFAWNDYAVYNVYGRGNEIRQQFKAFGIIIGRFLRLNLARRLGEDKFMELLPDDMKSKLVPLFPNDKFPPGMKNV